VTVVRPATLADEAPLSRIDAETQSWENSPAPSGPRFFSGRTTPDEVLVAERDGAVAGYVKLRPPTPLPSNAHVLEIQGLAVDPAHQRQGVARMLIAAAIEAARSRGARRLRLRVLEPNAAARALYAACGFEVVGVLPGEFHLAGRDVDDVLMSLDLTA